MAVVNIPPLAPFPDLSGLDSLKLQGGAGGAASQSGSTTSKNVFDDSGWVVNFGTQTPVIGTHANAATGAPGRTSFLQDAPALVNPAPHLGNVAGVPVIYIVLAIGAIALWKHKSA